MTLISDKGKKSVITIDFFFTVWKGTVLIVNPQQTAMQEPYYGIKQTVSYLYKY